MQELPAKNSLLTTLTRDVKSWSVNDDRRLET